MAKNFFGLMFAAIFAANIFSCAEAADSRVEAAVQFALEIAADDSHGYSQGAGIGQYTGSREGPDYDCSSLVYHAFNHGGFKIIDAWHKNPQYEIRYRGQQFSGDADTIWSDLETLGGWKKFSWNSVKNNLVRGDILCLPKKHCAIYIGNGQTVEARGVNNPRGGQYRTGDQGGEIDIYNAQGRGWTEVYRYTGD